MNDVFDAFEDFTGLYETSSTMGDTLAAISEDVLLRLPIEDCRGHCYDGAKNMSSHMKGTQAEICSKNSRAIYIHCFSHSLNLALRHASSTQMIQDDEPALAKKKYTGTSMPYKIDCAIQVFGHKELARNLQTSDISITSALRQTEIVMGHLTDIRTEEKFTELQEKVKK
ncbi:hypothetical protein PR048_024776 [Dryococelus australis]|uniref:Uncharacterized protein n=1 Tax=Dryococelus australis TaxID=614101 RepID=A0ABQ9GPM2_9NEOP|nr:hypothetical protein PR048_024776 [Dryococelus australis]